LCFGKKKEDEVAEFKGDDAEELARLKANADKHLTKADREAIAKYKINKKDDQEKGPIEERKCTDWLFAIFFVIALVAMGAAAVYGWA